ncbi:MAG: cation diffusion facilitator family transporter [Bacteroidales bacterium]|nr:cation diffusion facilitator family transporter [Bacteroidales bacterium]
MKNRQQEIVRTGYLGIATNALVASGKAVVGLAAGSMAIVLDAVNNLTDAMSSVITIIGVKLAGRPADDKHPFGYGRIEYFTALVIAAIILVAGATSLIESIKGIFEPSEQEYTTVGLCIVAASVVVKYFLGAYTKRKGKELSSDSLISSGTDCLFDCVISISTLVSAAITLFLGWNIDCWLAAAISCVVIKAGLEMLMSPVNELLGMRSDPELTAAIKARVKEIDGIRGAYDVVIHNYGPEQNIGALHVEVEDTMTAADLHHITRQIQLLVRKEFGIFVTVGFYAHNQENSDEAREENTIRQYVMSLEGILGMHGFYVNHSDKMLSFDVVYSFKVTHPITLRQQIVDWLQSNYSGYNISVGLDRNYSE